MYIYNVHIAFQIQRAFDVDSVFVSEAFVREGEHVKTIVFFTFVAQISRNSLRGKESKILIIVLSVDTFHKRNGLMSNLRLCQN